MQNTIEFIKEESPKLSHIKHDQLYKELISTFFEEFLELFFPEVYDHIDFHEMKPISEEVYTDLIEGDTRRLDIVIETRLKKTDVMIIVHIEPQSYVQSHFHERMFGYFSLLYQKYRKPIIPIAVFSYDSDWEKNTYTMTFPFFHVLTFRYLTLHLRKQNWRDFIRSDNPVAAALLSEMGYLEEEKIQVKLEFLRMMTHMKLDPAKQRLIYGFFETYLTLTEDEEEQLMNEIGRFMDVDEIMALPISYEEKGRREGKREVALEMLKKGFDLELISELTQLEIEEIEVLKNSY